ncbi:hypothetical protein EJ02DRAFT_463329 [Clathrospora elynae]|uniref:Uncharacterized protein n=1 Tax=Clathrospora elynae TaxID=706981 RepID=A0A6A5SZ03_9PLEO|nr:hypothetical protein EJ02DRAFT_463329 [Clathrospora elynae]
MGSRPGESIESSGWKDTNEGLLYRDAQIFRSSSAEYNGFLLHVQLRNRKGHSHNAKQGHDSPIMLLPEEPDDRSLCPVTYFLALALADGLFEGCKIIHDLQSKEATPGSSVCSFNYNASIGDKPIFRSVEPDGTISPTEILTHDCFYDMIRNLGQRARHEEKLSAYCLRRGYGSVIDTITIPSKAIISSLIGIDSQSVVHGRAQRVELFSSNSSMMLKRNLLAPMPPGSQLIGVHLHREIQVSDLDVLAAQRRQSRKKAFQEERQRFFQGDSNNTRSASTDASRSPSTYLQALFKFEAARHKIVTLMYPDIERGDDDSDLSLVSETGNPTRTTEATTK